MNKLTIKLLALCLLLALPAVVQAQFTYTTTNGAITLTGYTNTPPNTLIIPNWIAVNGTNLPVTSIADWAFAYFYNVTSITIGTNVTSIGNNSFEEAYALANLSIPNGVTSIGDYAFYGCNASSGRNSLNVTIPNSVTNLGADAFYASGVSSVTIPSSLTMIGDDAFQGCGWFNESDDSQRSHQHR